jgi:hypothetical protein
VSEVHVIVSGPEEAYGGHAEFWCRGRMMAVTVLEQGRLQLPTDARDDGEPWIVDTTSLAAGLAEAAQRLAAYCGRAVRRLQGPRRA